MEWKFDDEWEQGEAYAIINSSSTVNTFHFQNIDIVDTFTNHLRISLGIKRYFGAIRLLTSEILSKYESSEWKCFDNSINLLKYSLAESYVHIIYGTPTRLRMLWNNLIWLHFDITKLFFLHILNKLKVIQSKKYIPQCL